MTGYTGIMFIALFILIVIFRSLNLKKQGIEAIEFGKKDKNDFLIIPFAIFYLYLLTANGFDFPTIPNQKLFDGVNTYWMGVLFCFVALAFFIWTMISFSKSFRVGLVDNTAQGLITTGTFSISRNPIYLAFGMMLIGQFLIFPSWILLIYVFVGVATFHRQILKEEEFLKQQYGEGFERYCNKVRRYFGTYNKP